MTFNENLIDTFWSAMDNNIDVTIEYSGCTVDGITVDGRFYPRVDVKRAILFLHYLYKEGLLDE